MNHVMEKVYREFAAGDDLIATRNKEPLPVLPHSPALDAYTAYLHEEMRQSYLAGLDHAAIVTACALLEFTLKEAVYSRLHVQADCVFDQSQWDEVEKKDFAEILKRAKGLGVIPKKAYKALDGFRDSVRNNYMHGTTPAQVKKTQWQVFEGNWQTGEAKLRKLELSEDLSLQRIGRLIFDRKQCDPVVLFVDRVVRDYLQMRDFEVAKWKADHPTEKPTRDQFDVIIGKMKSLGFDGGMVVTRDLPG